MALIKCSECGQDVSDKAPSCPHCGNPISTDLYSTEDISPAPLVLENLKENKQKWVKKKIIRPIITIFWFLILSTIIFFLLIKYVFPLIGGTNNNQLTMSSRRSTPTPTDPLAVQINPSGSKIYPVQENNLWGYRFYTSKIDQTGNIDIGSSAKQSIAGLLKALPFPPTLTNKLIIIGIDPTITTSNDKVAIPWAGVNNSVALQPEGGTYQNISGGAIIALNNLVGFDLSILAHELGHLIGYQLTDEEWAKYYKLRGIPPNTPRRSSDWSSSPTEDFAEVYKYIYYPKGQTVKTVYGGILLPIDGVTENLANECYFIAADLEREWLSKYGVKDGSLFGYDDNSTKKAENAIQANPQLQSCREKNSQDKVFGAALYFRQVSEATRDFVVSIVDGLLK